MINDVLDLSRIESGNVRLQARKSRPASADRRLALARRRRCGAARHRRSGAISAPARSAVVGDVTRVKQILINLLSNAIKYNIDYGKIEISTRRDEPHVTLVVARQRPGHDRRAAGRTVPAVQPPRPRALGARRHRHRARHQRAPGRMDGRQPARRKQSRRRFVVHPERCRSPTDRGYRALPTRPETLRRDPTTTVEWSTTSRTTRPMSR